MTRAQELLTIADALVDLRTLRRYQRGENVRGLQRERIESALRRLGLAHLVRVESATTHPETRPAA